MKDGVAVPGTKQSVSFAELISRATELGLPQEYADQLETSIPNKGAANAPTKSGLPD